MGKGYAEDPRSRPPRRRARRRRSVAPIPTRRAVQGSTKDQPERHFLGWADEVDADELFRSGQAWGIRIVEVADEG